MPGLTSYHLKLIAALTMLVDHIGVLFYSDADWLRAIGRISFPLFVWLLVQGEAHTKDVWRYGLRLGLLGLISQPIYQLTFDNGQLNILFELLIGLICLRGSRQYPTLRGPIWITGAFAAELLPLGYGSYGIVLILLARYFRLTWLWCLAWIGLHGLWTLYLGPFQLPAMGAPLLFMAFNGGRGPKVRWFYAFYPGHLALLTLIRGL